MPNMVKFSDFVEVMQRADYVIIKYDEAPPELADFVGWQEEGDEESPFAVGTDSGWDIEFPRGQDVESLPNGYQVPGEGILVVPVRRLWP